MKDQNIDLTSESLGLIDEMFERLMNENLLAAPHLIVLAASGRLDEYWGRHCRRRWRREHSCVGECKKFL